MPGLVTAGSRRARARRRSRRPQRTCEHVNQTPPHSSFTECLSARTERGFEVAHDPRIECAHQVLEVAPGGGPVTIRGGHTRQGGDALGSAREARVKFATRPTRRARSGGRARGRRRSVHRRCLGLDPDPGHAGPQRLRAGARARAPERRAGLAVRHRRDADRVAGDRDRHRALGAALRRGRPVHVRRRGHRARARRR